MLKLTFKIWLRCSSAACPSFSKLPTINWTQWSTKALFSSEQSLNFRIIMNLSSYRLNNLRSNRIYDIFIVEWSYEYQIQNVSTQLIYFHDHMLFFIINWLMHRNKLIFFLRLIRIYVNNQTISQPFYDIIIYRIYFFFKWSIFNHHQKVSNKNRHFGDYLHVVSYQMIVWLK